MPRRIILDQTGEWEEYSDIVTDTLPEFAAALREYHHKRKWTISYTLSDDRFDDLARWLVPQPDISTSPIIALGGAAVLVDEADLTAHKAMSKPVKSFYRRSRHVGLTIISATQRPGNVSREVTAQSTHILAYYLSEPRDRDYIADFMRWDSQAVDRWLAWVRLHPHGAAWKEVQTGRLLWIPERGDPLADSQPVSVSAAGDPVQPELPPSPPQRHRIPKRTPGSESQDDPNEEVPDDDAEDDDEPDG